MRMLDFAVSLPLLAVVMFFVFGFVSRNKRTVTDLRIEAFKKYHAAIVSATDPQYAFNPSSAKIVKQDINSDNREDTTYLLSIYARNDHGEYFSFKSDGKSSSIRHMEHKIAKLVLNEQYIQ
jgi:hypothetical protein